MNSLLRIILISLVIFTIPHTNADDNDNIQTRAYISKNCIISFEAGLPQQTGFFAALVPILAGLVIDGVADAIGKASQEKSETKVARTDFYLLRSDPLFNELRYNEEFECITVIAANFSSEDMTGGTVQPDYQNWDNKSTDQKLVDSGLIKDLSKTTVYSLYEGRLGFSDDLTAASLYSQYLEVRKLFSTSSTTKARGLALTFDLQAPGSKSLMLGSISFGDIKAGHTINRESFASKVPKGVRTNLMPIPGATKQVSDAFKEAKMLREISGITGPLLPCEKSSNGHNLRLNAAATGCFSPVTLVVRQTEVKKANRVGQFVSELLGETKSTIVSEINDAFERPSATVINAAEQALLDANVAVAQAELAKAMESGDATQIQRAQSALNDALLAAAEARQRGASNALRELGSSPQTTSGSKLKFKSLDPKVQVEQATENLIGGWVVDSDDWPASFFTTSGESFCTGTLIGPRVLLTAAHCVELTSLISIDVNNIEVDGFCTIHPNYRRYGKNQSLDYALCLLDNDVAVSKYETINQDQQLVNNVGNQLLLSGYGCTRIGGGGADGLYRVGYSKLIENPGPQTIDYMDFIHAHGRVALCSGDSGGPAFHIPYSGSESIRSLVAVNAQSNLETWSLLSATSRDQAITFFDAWSTRNGAPMICGISHTGAPCRETE